MKQFLLCFCTVLSCLLISAGCKSYQGDFVEKTEAQLQQMEQESLAAHNAFMCGNYEKAAGILRELTKERTVSRPLYQLEMLSVLLLDEKYDEAHQLMLKLQEDIETLFDPEFEEKAQSIWHGEVNKVYKGDSYERATFYALLALSFIRQGNYEDALRSVKNGLLADADSREEKSWEDYALLHYLGSFSSAKMGNTDDAERYRKEMVNALRQRGFSAVTPDGKKLQDHCFENLPVKDCNVLLVLWTGRPPTVICTGEYKEKRSIIRGTNPFDIISVAVSGQDKFFAPNNLGDMEYQATTRGGREMDNVLADQAAAKKALQVSSNVFFIVGSGLIIAGARTMSAPAVGISLLGAGGGCYLAGACCYIVGRLMNPAADQRYWRNIPGQFYIIPLNLKPGKHQVMINGYKMFDSVGMSLYNIHVPSDAKTTVYHLPMMLQGYSAGNLLQNNQNQEFNDITGKINGNRMLKEIR